jgi:hypothetical protein
MNRGIRSIVMGRRMKDKEHRYKHERKQHEV